MAQYLIPTIFLGGAFVLAMTMVLFTIGSLRITKSFHDGLFPWVFYAMFFSNGLAVLLSSRNFLAAGELISESVLSNPLSAWAIRLTSLLALIASADQLAKALSHRARATEARLVFIVAALGFWVSSIAIPTVFAANPTQPQLARFYLITVTVALILLNGQAAQRTIIAIRNASTLFCVVSLLLVVVKPSLVLQTGYGQGFLGPIPRFFGLAPHAIMMGSLTCVGLWSTIYYPFQNKRIQNLVMATLLLVLLLTQAKAVWITFLLTIPVLIAGRSGLPTFHQLASSKHRTTVVVAILAVMGAATAMAILIAFGDVGQKLARFLDSDQGAQVTSFTGRDVIWAVAIEEWKKSPIFGYGLSVFGAEHRASIGMWFATSGHNQVMDSLARTGLVGTIGMLVYTFVLLGLSIKYRKESRGLSMVLIISLIVRMISEIPLSMGILGLDSTTHFLLVCVLAKCIQDNEERAKIARTKGGSTGTLPSLARA